MEGIMKEKTIGFMTLESEKRELEKMAKASRKSLSELIRNLIQNGKDNIAVIDEIKTVGNQLSEENILILSAINEELANKLTNRLNRLDQQFQRSTIKIFFYLDSMAKQLMSADEYREYLNNAKHNESNYLKRFD
jgi:predicted CopG family antitoxin